jgi:hypothetical protein
VLTEDPTIDSCALVALLSEYRIAAARLEFLPIGADGHNYRVEGGGRWFVSVKRVMAHREAAVDARGLERSYRAARRLCDEADIDFMSLALPRADGQYVSTFAGRANAPTSLRRWPASMPGARPCSPGADRLSRPHGDDPEDRRAREQLIQRLGLTG